MQPVSLGNIAEVFRCKVLCLLAFYADESYDSTTFCVGGWLHHIENWKELESKWSERIKYESRRSVRYGLKPISRFHAADCSNRRREFDGWTVDRHKLFFKKLVGIICKHKPFGIAWTASFQDLFASFPDYEQKTAQRVLYLICMRQCLRDLASIMREHYPGERVVVIHDFGFNGVAQRAFEIAKKFDDPSRTIISVMPGEWRDFIALQPADLMAYEGLKVCFRHRNNNPEIRRSFRRILGADLRLSVGYLDESVFELAKKSGVTQSSANALP